MEENMKYGKILIIDDNRDILQAAKMLLKRHFQLINIEPDPSVIPMHLKNEEYDLVLLDMNFSKDSTSGQEGFQWLEKILDISPSTVVILMTAFGDIDMAVKGMRKGATDFVLKPWNNEKLVTTITNALELRASRRKIDMLESRNSQLYTDMDRPFREFIGDSPAMKSVFHTISKVADTDANVLILGENGTGKELVARALHRNSSRKDNPFVGVDMGAVSETLFESELFGHNKGAFTDASRDRSGRFETAVGGTLFLDEITNLSLSLQAKILRVLETRQVTRLGSDKAMDIDIRLISATNTDIHTLAADKDFRQDLLYRINTVEIHLPPLRERREDIPLLADHYLNMFCTKYKKKAFRINSGALDKLRSYSWPGNVRELKHSLERAVILSSTEVLGPEDFHLVNPKEDSSELSFPDYNLESVEKLIIMKALQKYSGNITKAASELGLTRSSLYRRMEKYNI